MILTKYRLIDENGSFTESLNLQDAENHGNYIVITEEIAEANKPKIPQLVKSIAFLIALEFIGITKDAVLSFIETLPSPNNIIVKHSFERATFFERNSPFIPMVGVAFNKSNAQLDEVFVHAKEIENQLGL